MEGFECLSLQTLDLTGRQTVVRVSCYKSEGCGWQSLEQSKYWGRLLHVLNR